MQIADKTALSTALALEAIREIGETTFTVSAQLDVADPSTLHNFRIFGDLLAKAYQQGFDAGQGQPGIDLTEAHEHVAARMHSEADLAPEGDDAPWRLSPVVELDDALVAKLKSSLGK